MNKKNAKISIKEMDLLTISVLACIAFILYYLFMQRVFPAQTEKNSDMLFYMMAGKDLFEQGNVLLEAWHGGATNTYYFLILLYGFIGKLIGYNYKLLWIVSSILFSLYLVTMNWIILRHSLLPMSKRYILICFTTALTFFSVYLRDNGINAGLHIDATMITIIFFHIMDLNSPYTIRKVDAIAYLLFFLGGISDTFVIIVVVLSLFVVLVWNVLYKTEYVKRIFSVFTTALLLSVLCKVVLALWGVVFMQNKVIGYITSSDQILNSIVFTFESILNLFGVNIFGQVIDGSILPKVLVGGVLVVLLGILIVQRLEWQYDLMSQVCIGLMLSVIVIMIFLDHSAKQGGYLSSRLMYVFFFAVLFLITKIDYNKIATYFSIKENWIYSALCVLICMISVISVRQLMEIPKVEYTKYDAILQKLEDEKLKHGFASYTNSFSIAIESGHNVDLTTLYGFPTIVFTMLNKEPDETNIYNYVIIDDNETWVSLSRENVIKTFGEPKKEYDFDNLHLLIWDENLLPYVVRKNMNVMAYKSSRFNYSADVKKEKDMVYFGEGVIQYGPYVEMDAGNYTLTYFGEHMERVEPILIGYEDEQWMELPFELLEKDTNRIKLKFKIEKKFSSVEYRLVNTSNQIAIFEKLVVQRMMN